MTEPARSRKELARRHIARPIRLRVRIYVLIFLVLAVFVVVDVIRIGGAAVVPVLVSLAGGLVVGMVASRMFALRWDEVSRTVVGSIDVIGAVVLVAYILFSIFRTTLLGLWLDGPVLAVAGLAALAGVMAGQVVGTRNGVRDVLRIVVARHRAQPPLAAGEPDPVPSDG